MAQGRLNAATPLHWAAERGQKAIAELLIDKGTDINVNRHPRHDRTPEQPLTVSTINATRRSRVTALVAPPQAVTSPGRGALAADRTRSEAGR
jgi:ankyrin repeat protein